MEDRHYILADLTYKFKGKQYYLLKIVELGNGVLELYTPDPDSQRIAVTYGAEHMARVIQSLYMDYLD